MEIKDLNYINECVTFINGFGGKQIKPLTTEMVATKEQIDEYKKALTMCLNSKRAFPDFADYQKKTDDANVLLDQLLKYKKVSRIPR